MKDTRWRRALAGMALCAGCWGALPAQVVNPFGHALIPDMVADASIQVIDGVFYCYATTDGYGKGLQTSGPPVVWKSEDFVHWSFDGTYFPSAEKEKYWAPSKVVPANGRYYIYPTVNGFMYPAVADSPDGPFRLARGEDKFVLPFTPGGTLLEWKDPRAIDAEIFVDDDGQAYLYWWRRNAAKLGADMVTVDSVVQVIPTPRTAYSEGPIFFKRNGIYYYLYTQGGGETYQYAYVMGRQSPLGPFEVPKEDLVSTSNVAGTGVSGPGHGCVFNVPGTDDYYFAFLEYGRGSTNRQTYVNRLEFNADGTIRPVKVSMDGVGALKKVKRAERLPVDSVYASSVREPLFIPLKETPPGRTEYFVPEWAVDGANGSRWMAAPEDNDVWLVADLGRVRRVRRSEVWFVRPTEGHAYELEASKDGKSWVRCGGHDEVRKLSPHTDELRGKYRYLRIRLKAGIKGVWEWHIY